MKRRATYRENRNFRNRRRHDKRVLIFTITTVCVLLISIAVLVYRMNSKPVKIEPVEIYTSKKSELETFCKSEKIEHGSVVDAMQILYDYGIIDRSSLGKDMHYTVEFSDPAAFKRLLGMPDKTKREDYSENYDVIIQQWVFKDGHVTISIISSKDGNFKIPVRCIISRK